MSSMKDVGVSDIMNQAFLQVVYGKLSAEEAVAEAEQKTNDLLAEG